MTTPRSGEPPPRTRRAIVIGAGIGGIAAAAALRDVADDVIVLEHDEVSRSPEVRRGVPQAGQLHNLLSPAQIELDALLPGFIDGLVKKGGVRGRVSSDTHVFELGIRMPERDLGMSLCCATRPVIEHVARSLLLDHPAVRLLAQTKVMGLIAGDGRVQGVEVEKDGETHRLSADVVVDASGTGTAAPAWMKSLGVKVSTEHHRVDQWYVSSLYERADSSSSAGSPTRFWLVFPTPPRSRGGLASPVGDDQLYVSVSGTSVDEPPRSPAEVLAYAETLEDPALAGVIRASEPLGDPHLFRKPSATWHHYESLAEPMAGFLPLGDAFASLNPLFGQGMSVAALEAAHLKSTAQAIGLAKLDELTRSYLRGAADAIQLAWDLGRLVDPSHDGTGLQHAQALARLIEDDSALHRLYVRVWHLLEPVSALESPQLLARVEAAIDDADDTANASGAGLS